MAARRLAMPPGFGCTSGIDVLSGNWSEHTMNPAGYEAATRNVGLIARSDRGLLVVRGADRAAWLHNLVTHEVKKLSPGQGNYAFATNVKGRVLFDLNLLVQPEAIWLDIERDGLTPARTHLERYIITEDVTIDDQTEHAFRIALAGPACATLAERLGLSTLPEMGQLDSAAIDIAGHDVTAFRHDFAGLLGVEIIALDGDPAGRLRAAVQEAGASLGLADVSPDAAEVLRIEAGRPRMGRELDGEILPAETGQVDRAVSYHKGCYLGQEIIERMRSRGSLARQLVGFKIDGEAVPETGATVHVGDADVGRITSACQSPAAGGPIALGYVRSAKAAPGTAVTIATPGEPLSATVAALPFRNP